MKKTESGYGEIIYKEDSDFPEEINYNGYQWHKTVFRYTFGKTGMVNFQYETDDRVEDLRLYLDAAGNIWDEMEKGIL